MSPVLVDSIRQRMREQTTEQLLEMWVTNDRATWSGEAFEAVKQTLAERGRTDLPPQNGPAPLVTQWSPSVEPKAIYWMGWLRPVLWIAIVLASLALVRAPVTVWTLWQALLRPTATSWTPTALLPALASDVVLPGWLLVGSIATLKLRPWGRTTLLLYAPLVLVLVGWMTALGARQYWGAARGAWYSAMLVLNRAEVVARAMVLPTVLLFLLRRGEIRSLFIERRAGFHADPPASISAPEP